MAKRPDHDIKPDAAMHKRGVSHAPPLAAPPITRHNLLPSPAAPVVAYVS
jgi:hypothetical protein